MKSLFWDLPRAFNCFDRVRGVSLTKDTFHEEDLLKVLKVGVYTQDDWCVTLERWVEKPLDDFLTILPVWVRLYEIPVNYYNEATITDIARCPDNPARGKNLIKLPVPAPKSVPVVVDVQRPKLLPDDPLFGVLTEDQVGMDSRTGKLKIDNDVLNVARQYLQVVDPTGRKARELRVKQSILDLERDSLGQNSVAS
ncbi:unnamed protein product [Microthlaspi erraticum]|uniref:Uncharacterized protein n=1 Tax=Microthlaspi erraticum TaxID=1685480 RepID=A0A6D2JB21_9BRAS|nr:unnamed protein product [Microthlaspi erraticum]CAA7036231.1 unnamed protein product [Microthlaspi erraticum]